jgi:methylated-DNA-protein-cysteine methyltransferase-like protein
MEPFTKRVIDTIKSIPNGRVMTYGQVAETAGSKRGARQVVRILHTMGNAYDLPWHRIVNAKGEIALQDEESRYTQIHNLQAEGIELDDAGRIDLERFRFIPALK